MLGNRRDIPFLVTRAESGSLSKYENNFRLSVQKHWREGEEEKKERQFKAFWVTRKCKKLEQQL